LDTLCHSDGRPSWALTVVWKLSYATDDGHLPNQREKCGLMAQEGLALICEAITHRRYFDRTDCFSLSSCFRAARAHELVVSSFRYVLQ